MRVLCRLAVRMAFGKDGRHRLRQLSVVGGAFIATICLMLGLGTIHAAQRTEQSLSGREMLAPASSADARLTYVLRGFTIDRREVLVVWIEPEPGHEHDPPAVPPGLRRLPEPGGAVLSPGLVRLGVSAADLGFGPSSAGAGPSGTIGRAGVGTDDELLAYVRPTTHRTVRGGFESQSAGFAPIGTRASGQTPLVTDSPMLSRSDAIGFSAGFLGFPALLLLGLAVRARSAVRTARAQTLLRMGIPRGSVRFLLGLEGGLLAVIGAVAGALLYAVAAGRVTAIPLTATVLFPGDLDVRGRAAAAAVASVVAVAAVISASGRLRPSTRRRVEHAGDRRLIPLALGLALVILDGRIESWTGIDAQALFGVGTILLLGAVAFATPTLARILGAFAADSADPRRWLAGRRVTHAPRSTSRVAVLVITVIYLGSISIAVFFQHSASIAVSPKPSIGGVGVVAADWLDPRSGDLASLRRRVAAEGGVVLPVTSLEAEPGFVVDLRGTSCAELEPFARGAAVALCTDGRVDAAALARIGEVIGYRLVAGVPDQGRVDPGGDPADVRNVLILTPRPLSGAQRYAVGAGLAAFNPSDLLAYLGTKSVQAGWIALGWAVSLVVLVLAIARELIEFSLGAMARDERVWRLGLDAADADAVSWWTLGLPILAATSVGWAVGLAVAFRGTSIQVTSFAPLAISAYALAVAGLAFGSIWVAMVVRAAAARSPAALV